MLDLEPIKARLAAATPGPWEWEAGSAGVVVKTQHTLSYRREFVARIVSGSAGNVALMTAAPADVAALVAEVERLQSNLDTVCEALSWYGNLVYSHTMGLPPEVQWIAENALEKVGRLKE